MPLEANMHTHTRPAALDLQKQSIAWSYSSTGRERLIRTRLIRSST